MSIKKTKLDYRPAVRKNPPIAETEIPSSEMERLDRSIKTKVFQNRKLYDKTKSLSNLVVR